MKELLLRYVRIKLNKSVEAGDLVGIPIPSLSLVAPTLPDENVSHVYIIVRDVGQLQRARIEVDRLLPLVSAYNYSVSALNWLHLPQTWMSRACRRWWLWRSGGSWWDDGIGAVGADAVASEVVEHPQVEEWGEEAKVEACTVGSEKVGIDRVNWIDRSDSAKQSWVCRSWGERQSRCVLLEDEINALADILLVSPRLLQVKVGNC